MSAVQGDPAPAAGPITVAERSLAPDVARGAMLLLIAVANVGAYLWGRPQDQYGHDVDASAGDRIALVVEQLVIAERSRPMFAILYGFGLAVMASRMWARGADVAGARRVLRRRGWWLVALGLAHGSLLFFGDILAVYGASGLIALMLVHLPDRQLRGWLWGTGAFVVLVSTPVTALVMAGPTALEEGSVSEPLTGTTYLGSVLAGLGLTVAGVLLAVLTITFVPLMLAGMVLRRAGWLDRPAEHLPGLRRVFWSAMAVNVLSSLPVALVALGAWQPDPAPWIGATFLTLAGGMYAGLGYVCGFALLAHRWTVRRTARGSAVSGGVPGALAALGARSLTGYLGQSFLLAPLLSAWGLGLGAGMGSLAAYAVAVGAWAVTLVLAVVLARRGHRGPFEVLLRRLTYREHGRAAPVPPSAALLP